MFAAVTAGFKTRGARDLLARVEAVNDFRNTYVAHSEKPMHDYPAAQKALRAWVDCLAVIHQFGGPAGRGGREPGRR